MISAITGFERLMISQGKEGWEPMLPSGVAEIIKEHHLFGYEPSKFLKEV